MRHVAPHFWDLVAALAFGVSTMMLFEIGSDRGERAVAAAVIAVVSYTVVLVLRRVWPKKRSPVTNTGDGEAPAATSGQQETRRVEGSG